ncbi:MAG: glycosyltransferase family 2 protein, partial [Chitinophagales bacterium]
EVNRLMAGKKFPLTLGIKAAAYDLLVLTDADCVPASANWLKETVACYGPNHEIVLGYGAYEKERGFLNKVIRFETVFTALNYFSFALAGLPYMGVGRNLSYKKELFFNSGGFTDHRTIPSGDDDLFINKVARKKNTSISIAKNAFTYSSPKRTWSEWKEQKTRHVSTAKYYKPIHKFFLGLYPVTQIAVWLLTPVLLAFLFMWYYVAGLFFLRWITQRVMFTNAMRRLDAKDLISHIELFDLLQVIYYFRFARAAVVKTKYRWN